MAGNIVKWWKHKILGGYKQFSVQECTTDSEELMYHQVRASSSCSAPPDLLLGSERDNNIQLRTPVVNIITTPPGLASSKQQQQSQPQSLPLPQQQQQQQHHVTRQDMSSKHLRISSSSGKHGKYANMQLPAAAAAAAAEDADVVDAAAAAMSMPHGQHSHSRHHHNKEERIRLEEFTCDVSVEGGKSTQPLQFSFTFYDLDGHHGKITKDDIVGIVYTIYESIGKSVVVPHCGSKTINVRLTVSPEGKSKTQPAAAACHNNNNNNNNNNSSSINNSNSNNNASKLKKLPTGMSMGMGMGMAASMSKTVNGIALTTSGGARRQHRHRPRKLIKSDDEDDDSNSDKERELTAAEQLPSGSKPTAAAASKAARYQKNNAKLEACCNAQQQQQQQQQQAEQHTPDNGHNTYENLLNLKCSSNNKEASDALECTQRSRHHHHQAHHSHSQQQQQQQHSQDIYMKQATQRVKMLRRARKQKYQDHCLETRQRSQSVGNDACWQNRHLQQQQQQQQQQTQQQLASPVPKSASVSPPLAADMMLDGVQLRQPRPQSLLATQQQRKSAECWKSALNRNDLISIIRESMEKNRLCFQLNGKPQANVSPIRQLPPAQQQQQQQRQRCSTGSKIPTLIANHSLPQSAQSPLSCSPPTPQSPQPQPCAEPAPLPNNNNNNNHIEAAHEHTLNSSSAYHPQPHIPIYHQQLAINPAVLAAQHSHNSAHNKLNLCGYDSFLHATICGGGASAHSPPATPSNVATVQPIPKKSQQKLQAYQRLEQQQQQQQRSSKHEQRRQRHKLQQQQQQLPAKLEPARPVTSSSSSGASKIYGDALECAHLLASEEEELAPSPMLTSTPRKVVSTNTLIDLNDDVGEAVAEAVTTVSKDAEELPAAGCEAAELDTSASSSMIHRYVHEHIHHHYHHFKEQQQDAA